VIQPGPGGTAEVRLPDSIDHPLLRRMPAAWRPYVQLARIDRPIGWWLLLLPCWWSAALAGVAQGHGPSVLHLALFLVGAIAMRGAGSTYNDLVDREIDAKVERTRDRPLPSGRVTPRQAKLFMLAQCGVGALVLFSLNWFSIGLGIASLAIVALYPFMKRITFWPQAVLGLAFAYGGLMGWAAAYGSLAWPALAIYVSAIFWTIGYDTIYALQDARDDAIAGVRSTARLFAGRVISGVSLFYLLAILAACLGVQLARGGILAWAGVFGFALHLAWQVRSILPGDPARALMLFRSNRNAGLILFAGLTLDGLRRMALG
jgi:4-hydroxybenzoate polyprenyltransferase